MNGLNKNKKYDKNNSVIDDVPILCVLICAAYG